MQAMVDGGVVNIVSSLYFLWGGVKGIGLHRFVL